MKKILTLLVISILVLGGIGAVAIPSNKQMVNNNINMQEFELEISIQGGLFGYIINVNNLGTEPVIGNLSIDISTGAMVMLIGGNLSKEFAVSIDPGSAEGEFKVLPLIGFGDATMSMSGVFRTQNGDYSFGSTNERGYIFLIYVVFSELIFHFP